MNIVNTITSPRPTVFEGRSSPPPPPPPSSSRRLASLIANGVLERVHEITSPSNNTNHNNNNNSNAHEQYTMINWVEELDGHSSSTDDENEQHVLGGAGASGYDRYLQNYYRSSGIHGSQGLTSSNTGAATKRKRKGAAVVYGSGGAAPPSSSSTNGDNNSEEISSATSKTSEERFYSAAETAAGDANPYRESGASSSSFSSSQSSHSENEITDASGSRTASRQKCRGATRSTENRRERRRRSSESAKKSEESSEKEEMSSIRKRSGDESENKADKVRRRINSHSHSINNNISRSSSSSSSTNGSHSSSSSTTCKIDLTASSQKLPPVPPITTASSTSLRRQQKSGGGAQPNGGDICESEDGDEKRREKRGGGGGRSSRTTRRQGSSPVGSSSSLPSSIFSRFPFSLLFTSYVPLTSNNTNGTASSTTSHHRRGRSSSSSRRQSRSVSDWLSSTCCCCPSHSSSQLGNGRKNGKKKSTPSAYLLHTLKTKGLRTACQELYFLMAAAFRHFSYEFAYDAQMWLAAAVLGVLAALTAAITELGTQWLSNLKIGRCVGGSFFSSEASCCRNSIQRGQEQKQQQRLSKHPTDEIASGRTHQGQGVTGAAATAKAADEFDGEKQQTIEENEEDQEQREIQKQFEEEPSDAGTPGQTTAAVETFVTKTATATTDSITTASPRHSTSLENSSGSVALNSTFTTNATISPRFTLNATESGENNTIVEEPLTNETFLNVSINTIVTNTSSASWSTSFPPLPPTAAPTIAPLTDAEIEPTTETSTSTSTATSTTTTMTTETPTETTTTTVPPLPPTQPPTVVEAVTQCSSFVEWNDLAHDSTGLTGLIAYSTLAIVFATISGYLCFRFAPLAAGSGIVEMKTILSGVRIPGFLTFRVFVVKCVGLMLSVGSGLTLGKEGPFVHIGCCLAYLTAQLFPRYRNSEAQQRELLSSGAAAGVAVAFGAPIGGVLFSLEEVSYYFPHRTMLQAFFTAIVADIVLKKLDVNHNGHAVQISTTFYHTQTWHWFELGTFALIGALGGLLGCFINWLNSRIVLFRRQQKTNQLTEIAVTALFTSLLAYLSTTSRYGMLEVLGAMFSECESPSHHAATAYSSSSSSFFPASSGASSYGSRASGGTSGVSANTSQNPRVLFTSPLTAALCHDSDAQTVISLLYAILIRTLLMAVTFGMKLPAGCFVPSLFIGGCMGRIIGMWSQSIVGKHLADEWPTILKENLLLPIFGGGSGEKEMSAGGGVGSDKTLLSQLFPSVVQQCLSRASSTMAYNSGGGSMSTSGSFFESASYFFSSSSVGGGTSSAASNTNNLFSSPSFASLPPQQAAAIVAHDCINPAIYAAVGAAAVLCGVTRMTICLVVIMLEVIGGLDHIVPCMVAVIVAKWVSDSSLVGIPSIYDVHLQFTPYPYIDPKEEFNELGGGGLDNEEEYDETTAKGVGRGYSILSSIRQRQSKKKIKKKCVRDLCAFVELTRQEERRGWGKVGESPSARGSDEPRTHQESVRGSLSFFLALTPKRSFAEGTTAMRRITSGLSSEIKESSRSPAPFPIGTPPPVTSQSLEATINALQNVSSDHPIANMSGPLQQPAGLASSNRHNNTNRENPSIGGSSEEPCHNLSQQFRFSPSVSGGMCVLWDTMTLEEVHIILDNTTFNCFPVVSFATSTCSLQKSTVRFGTHPPLSHRHQQQRGIVVGNEYGAAATTTTIGEDPDTERGDLLPYSPDISAHTVLGTITRQDVLQLCRRAAFQRASPLETTISFLPLSLVRPQEQQAYYYYQQHEHEYQQINNPQSPPTTAKFPPSNALPASLTPFRQHHATGIHPANSNNDNNIMSNAATGHFLLPPALALATQPLDWSRKLDKCTITVTMEMSVQRLLHMFKSLGNHQVLVLHCGRLEGIVTRKDLMLYVKANAASRQYHNKIVLAEKRRLEQQMQ